MNQPHLSTISGTSTTKMPEGDEESLVTLLNVEQRAELSMLIAKASEEMRNGILRTFEASSTSKTQTDVEGLPSKPDAEQDQSAPSLEDQESARKEQGRHETALSAPEIQELKASALTSFDAWNEKVILRVGEVLNSRDHAQQSKDRAHAKKVANANPPQTESHQSQLQASIDKASITIYPVMPTPLAALSYTERITILNSILLLLLSLETYAAHSRTLLMRLASSLNISPTALTKMEKDIALGLLTAASKMDGSASATAAQKANATSRKWKVGLASVAGAALIGVTGGLAAPLVAAGVGGLLSGVGLGATAAAGYLGALAGSGALVGGLFGAYGGRMTGRMMDQYAKDVEDFAFLEVYADEGTYGRKDQKEKRRLRVTVGISGWLTDEKQVVSPWRVLGDGGEPFALRWELKALLALGNALQNFLKSYAWSYIKKELIKRTVLAGLYSALMLPLAVVKTASKVVDSPWGIAKLRADKAGQVLAHAVVNKAQGERPISLIGYSLGARVIYQCLLSLAEQKAFGLVDSVVLMGAPTPRDAESWRAIRTVVSGRVVNVFSENDYILAFLYRTSSVQLGVAGLQAVEGVHGVENVDVSESVTGHLRYPYMAGSILAKVGWTDVDEAVLRQEERLLQEMIRKEQQAAAKEGDGSGDVDEQRLQEEATRLEKEQQQQQHKGHGQGFHFQRSLHKGE